MNTNAATVLSTLGKEKAVLRSTIGNVFGEDHLASVAIKTGSHSDGYLLNSITVEMGNAGGSPSGLRVTIAPYPSSGEPLVLLDAPSAPRRAGRYTAKPKSEFFMAPNSKYFLVAGAGGNAWNNYFTLPVTLDTTSSHSSFGWRINSALLAKFNSFGEIEPISALGIPLIAIDATPVLPPPPPMPKPPAPTPLPPDPPLAPGQVKDILLSGNRLIVTFTGTLYSSTKVTGPYQQVAGASPPSYSTTTTEGAARFYLAR